MDALINMCRYDRGPLGAQPVRVKITSRHPGFDPGSTFFLPPQEAGEPRLKAGVTPLRLKRRPIIQRTLLLRRRSPPKRRVATRKAAEASDLVMVTLGEGEDIGVPHLAEFS